MKRYVLSVIIKSILKHWRLTIPLVLVIIGSILFALLPPLVLERAVDLFVTGSFSLTYALLYFGALAISLICDSLRSILLTKLGQRITSEVRYAMIKKLDRLPARFFTDNESGKLASYYINDVEALDQLFKTGIISIFIDLGKIVGILVVLFTRSLGIGLLMTVFAPIIGFVTFKFKNKIRSGQSKNKKAIAALNGNLSETFDCFRTIKNLNKESFFDKKFSALVDESYRALETNNFFEAIYTPITNQTAVTVICIAFALAAAGGGWQSVFGLSVGTALAVIEYVFNIFSPIENIGLEIQNIQSSIAGIKRIDAFMAEPEREIPSGSVEFDYNLPAVEFDKVEFSYEDGVDVLLNENFTVSSGEKVTFSGRTGCGKTTTMKLILGLEKPKSGSVKVFGVDADKIPDGKKRELFGYIEQSVRTVPGAIKDQITLGEDYPEDLIAQTVERVGLKEKIGTFEKGLDSPFERLNFSDGQMQLMSLARTIIASPKIYLLDEITANLDSETELKVVNTVSAEGQNKTLISISHRVNNRIGEMRRIPIGIKKQP